MSLSEWHVELVGEEVDLKRLMEFDPASGVCASEMDGRCYLSAVEFNKLPNAKNVRNRAIELMKVINGAERLKHKNWRNVGVGAVIQLAADGKKHTTVFPETLHIRLSDDEYNRVMSGLGLPARPPSTVSSIEEFVQTAISDAAVQKVLRMYGSCVHDWRELSHMFEVIEEDVGGEKEIVLRGYTSGTQRSRFTGTANNEVIVGDSARHGHKKWPPHPNPMTIDEAREWFAKILEKWLKSKASLSSTSQSPTT